MHECVSNFRGHELLKCKFWPVCDARLKVRESLKSVGFILWCPWISVPMFLAIYQIVIEIFLYDSSNSLCQRSRLSFKSQLQPQILFVFSPLFFLFAVFQSKDIGIQMHEELVKVTNELYTVSTQYTVSYRSIPHTSSHHWAHPVLFPLSVFPTLYFKLFFLILFHHLSFLFVPSEIPVLSCLEWKCLFFCVHTKANTSPTVMTMLTVLKSLSTSKYIIWLLSL